MARVALDSIHSAGDGSRARSRTVLRPSDDYDVLRALGTDAATHAAVVEDGRTLDVLTGEDGRERYFLVDAQA